MWPFRKNKCPPCIRQTSNSLPAATAEFHSVVWDICESRNGRRRKEKLFSSSSVDCQALIFTLPAQLWSGSFLNFLLQWHQKLLISLKELKKAVESASQIQPLQPVLLPGSRKDSGTDHSNMAWNLSKTPAWCKCEADPYTTSKHNRSLKAQR